MLVVRSLFLIVRKYWNLCLILICLWLLIYALKEHLTSSLSPSTKLRAKNIDSFLQVDAPTLDDHSSTIFNPDVLLIIRTSKNTQLNRLPGIIKTWFQFSPKTTYITTNGDVNFVSRLLSVNYQSQIYLSQCKQAHTIRDLCCNSASEFDIYFQHEHEYKWLCRFDDDQYVNVPLLINYLKRFSPEKESLYIGKPSLKVPKQGHGIQFWFATYGGGVCFSKYLLNKIRDDIHPQNRFIDGCVASNYPDDTHIAYLLRKKYNINLTVAEDFHHHIEFDLFTNRTNPTNIDQAITLGFKGNNVPRFLPLIPNDHHHMQTLHCLLYPNRFCMRLIRILLNKLYVEK